jgi:hypothetical protein
VEAAAPALVSKYQPHGAPGHLGVLDYVTKAQLLLWVVVRNHLLGKSRVRRNVEIYISRSSFLPVLLILYSILLLSALSYHLPTNPIDIAFETNRSYDQTNPL